MSDKRATAQLLRDFNDLKKHPVEGFSVDLPNENNFFLWEVYIQGPPDTFYDRGAFRALLTFPEDFPYTPPKMVFTSEVWHPNVFWGGKKSGEVCISILHPPGGNPEMPDECESDNERWKPAHSVTTILLSIISMLSDPNFSSPANVDASVQWRRDIEGFEKKVAETVQKSLRELPTGFKFPQPEKPHRTDLGLSADEILFAEDAMETENDGFENIFSEVEGMGFDRQRIESVIKDLTKAGKRIDQDSVMERLLDE